MQMAPRLITLTSDNIVINLRGIWQLAMEGHTEAALLSLLEVDKDISTRLNKISEEEPDLMEVIRTSIEAVTSVLFQGLEKNISGNCLTNQVGWKFLIKNRQ